MGIIFNKNFYCNTLHKMNVKKVKNSEDKFKTLKEKLFFVENAYVSNNKKIYLIKDM